MLGRRAAGLTADGKQKISMGRGLVREDVNVIMFDEPLTVIDPHLKWKLRSKLKELHQRVGATMIYVTHDQTEALTFADQVVVMQDGEVVQIGSPGRPLRAPGAHLRRPLHRLARHEHPALRDRATAPPSSPASRVATANRGRRRRPQPRSASAPSSSSLGADGIPAEIVRIADVGRHRVVEAARRRPADQRAPARGRAGRARPGAPRLRARRRPASTSDGWLAEGARMKTENQCAWLFVLPVAAARRLQRAGAADDGGQLLGAGDLRQQRLLLARRRLVRGRAALARASTPRSAASSSSPASSS